ncbi:MAG: hypothetical protein ACM3YF_06550, partial [Candidatus Zixiibacteriota bacterium]
FFAFLLVTTVYDMQTNWAGSNPSKNRFAQEALENIYRSAPRGGLVFTTVWDHYAPWLYNHFVLGRRTDMRMLDVNLSNRSWYLDFLRRAYPETMTGLGEKIFPYRALLRDFEEGRPFDTATIEAAYQAFLAAVLRKGLRQGPVYFDVATNFDSAAGWVLVPEGALFRVYEKPGYYPFQTPALGFSPPASPVFFEDKLVQRELEMLDWMLKVRKNYEAVFGPKSPAGDTTNRP